MPNIFIVSDTHFGHANILNFIVHELDCPNFMKKRDVAEVPCECPHMRNFSSVEEMDEHMVDQWNKTVKPSDKVYHLGDVAMKKPSVYTIERCNGHKRLVRGNHDKEATKFYMQFFEEIYATRFFEDMVLSHIPIHIESLRDGVTNVHGHVHNNVPDLHYGVKYHNVCVEVTDYRPVSIEEVRVRIREQRAKNTRLVNAHLLSMGVKPLFTGDELYTQK